jgi:hypothetical protein
MAMMMKSSTPYSRISPSLDRLNSPKDFASADPWMRLGRFVDTPKQIRGCA